MCTEVDVRSLFRVCAPRHNVNYILSAHRLAHSLTRSLTRALFVVRCSPGDNEVQRTMLEIVNQLDGFEARGNIKVLMATNRPDTLDPALLRPGRLDRKVEFGLPDLEGRTQIFKIHTRAMNVERDIRYELLARLCPNCTGADIRSVCTEAGMFAIRSRRKTVTEKDFLDAVNKVIKGYQKFSATPKYLQYN